MAFLFFLTSCALFKGQTSLVDMDKMKMLDSVKLIGEGRGRLSLGQSQYVFGFDSILKENFDWILAVQIPLHGEEVMILPNLKEVKPRHEEMESFEERIRSDFSKAKLNKTISAKAFIQELRSLVRFNLGERWGGKRICKAQQNDFLCELDGETYLVSANEKEFSIIKSLKEGGSIVLNAKNLTESFFAQTDIRLYANATDMQKKNSIFSLELFWKN